MIYLHPSSTCDVCLDKYSWEEPDAPRPHAIRCGHVFCEQCLEHLRPKVCPFCRCPFTQTYRLHMDIVADENHLLLSTEDLEARRLAEKVVDVSTEDVEEDAYRAVLEEVFTWLNRMPTDAQKVLRAFATLLQQWRSLLANQQEKELMIQMLRNERIDLREKLTASEREREEERVDWRRQMSGLESLKIELEQAMMTKEIEADIRRKELEAQLARLAETNCDLVVDNNALAEAKEGLIAHRNELVATKEDLIAANNDFSTQVHDLTVANRELTTQIRELNATNRDLNAANRELSATNRELKTTNDDLSSTIHELTSQKQESSAVNDDLETTNRSLLATNNELNAEIGDLKAKITELRAELEDLRNNPPIVESTPIPPAPVLPAPSSVPSQSPLPSAPTVLTASNAQNQPITDAPYHYSPEPLQPSSPPRIRNPLPTPPVPVPDSQLPDFAKPDKYQRRSRDGERHEGRDEVRERDRDRDRARERERDRDRDKDRDRKKEKDRSYVGVTDVEREGDRERERERARRERRKEREIERERERERERDKEREREREREREKERELEREREKDREQRGKDKDKGYSRDRPSTRAGQTTSVRNSWYDEIPLHESELSQEDREREARRQRRREREHERRHTEGTYPIYPSTVTTSQIYAPATASQAQAYTYTQSQYDDPTQFTSLRNNSSVDLAMPRPKLPVPVDVYEGMALASNNRESGDSGTDRERERRALANSVLADTSYAKMNGKERKKEKSSSTPKRPSTRGVEVLSSSSKRVVSVPEGYDRRRDQEHQTVSSSYLLYPYSQYVNGASYVPAGAAISQKTVAVTSSSARRGAHTEGYETSYLSTAQPHTNTQTNSHSQSRTERIDRETTAMAPRERVRAHTLHASGSFDSPKLRRTVTESSIYSDPVSNSGAVDVNVNQARPRQRTMSHVQAFEAHVKTLRRRSLLDQLLDKTTSSSLTHVWEPVPKRHAAATAAIAEERERAAKEFGSGAAYVTVTRSQINQAENVNNKVKTPKRSTTATGANPVPGTPRKDRERTVSTTVHSEIPTVPPIPGVFRLQDSDQRNGAASTNSSVVRTRARTDAPTREGERGRDRKRATREHERYPGGYVSTAELPSDARATVDTRDRIRSPTRQVQPQTKAETPSQQRHAKTTPRIERKPTPPQPPRSEHIVYLAQTPSIDAFPFPAADLLSNLTGSVRDSRMNAYWSNYSNGPAEASSSTLVLPYIGKEGEKI